MLDGLRSADDAAVQGLVKVLSDWTQGRARRVPGNAAPPGIPDCRTTPLCPVACRRSPNTRMKGTPFPTADNKGAGGPDPDYYGVDGHPERFVGLHVIARALIDHLTAVNDVEVHKDPAHGAELLMEARDVLQGAKVTQRSGAAPLTFVLTETQADRMELLVLTVAAGGYSERYPVGSRRWSEYALTAFDG